MNEHRYRLAGHVRMAVEEGEGMGGVLIDIEEGLYFSVNPVGRLIAQQLESGDTRERVLDRLDDSFDVDRRILEADLDSFLDEMVERRLVCREASEGGQQD